MDISSNQKGIIYLPQKLYTVIATLPETKGIDKSYLAYLLHLILKGYTKRRYNATGWSHLSSAILKTYDFVVNNVRYGYKMHLDYLQNLDIVKRTGSYSTSKKRAKGHRINEQLLKLDDQLIPVIITPGLAAKLYSRQEKRKQQARRTTGHLTKWLDGLGFNFDTKAALDQVNTVFKDQTYKRLARMKEILQFDNMQYSRQGKDGRLHTNFTRMPSAVRCFVTYQGESLHAVDLPNSQPLMLSILIDAFFEELNKEMIKSRPSVKSLAGRLNRVLKKYCLPTRLKTKYDKKLYAITNNLISNSNKISYTLSPIIFPNRHKCIDYEYIKNFNTLVKENNLYQYVGEKLLQQGIIKQKGDNFKVILPDEDLKEPALKTFGSLRECGKEITFYALYSSVRTRNKAVNALKALFPDVFKIVDIIKGKESGGYKIFSYLLQNMESKFILDYTTKRIAKNYPAMPLITIHDSIATTQTNVARLKEEVEADFRKYFDVELSLVTEPW